MKYISFFCLSLIFISCKSDDESIFVAIEGAWFVETLIPADSPPSVDFSEAHVLWVFKDNRVTVVDYASETTMFASGEYAYSLNATEIVIDGASYSYTLREEGLIIYGNVLDGISQEFIPRTYCEIDDPLAEIGWLNELRTIFEMETGPAGNQIIQFFYNNQCVYWVDPCYQCQDSSITVYDIDKTVICEFNGTTGTSTCPGFLDQATNRRVLWNNVNP